MSAPAGALALTDALAPGEPALPAAEAPSVVSGAAAAPTIRVTGLLVEDDRILLVKEHLRERTHWNLPGGRLEAGETMAEALRREMREETGLAVSVGDLLYVTDRFRSLGNQTVDMSFLVRRTGGHTLAGVVTGKDGETLSAVRMVPIRELELYGFDAKFARLVRAGFPHRGSYQGDFHAFYG